MKKKRFRAEVEVGHKGAAVIVPFDPAEAFGTEPERVMGVRLGHFVRGTVGGARFEGWIERRWGRWFIRTDDALLAAAKARPGDVVEVVVEPRPPSGAAASVPPTKARRGTRAGGRSARRRRPT